MQHSAASHLGIRFCISTGLGVPRMHRANITSGDKKKYFCFAGDLQVISRGTTPSKGRNSSPAPDLPFCLSVCLSFSLMSVYRLFVSVCLSVSLFVSIRPSPSILHTVITIQANNDEQKLNETRGLLTL